jgi:HD-GYP domain-containing protein (c-di-GMP phosphodiesterase class II)
MVAVERLARRLLPLAALLKLSLIFPDRAPSRFRMAVRAGGTRKLEERLRSATEEGLPDTPAEAAEKVLELAALLNLHDRRTRGHSERVRVYSDLLADELGLSSHERSRLHWAALLHDIGKLVVPGDILNKAGAPTEDEWEILREHPLEGERFISPLQAWLGDWTAAIGQHHERYDGSGYPDGLAGERIPMAARIVAVADAFHAMTSDRPYRRRQSLDQARAEIARCAESHFCPKVVDAFLRVSQAPEFERAFAA